MKPIALIRKGLPVILFLALSVQHALSVVNTPSAKAPNVIIVIVDDMGFSDIGSFGGEIPTPELDRLAAESMRLTRFSATPKCHSSRVSLLTGLWCEQAGSISMRHGLPLPEILRSNGYATLMTGKWHLRDTPLDHGFEKYFGHLSGASDFVAGNDSFLLNRDPFKKFGEDASEFYLTDANTDFAIQFLDEWESSDDGRPFFLYMAYNAPHDPLQAPEELVRRHLGRYSEGWEVIQRRRFAKQRELGLFPEELELPPWAPHHRKWDDLSVQEKEWEDYRMAIYAAMIDSLDANLKRLNDRVRELGEWDNTILIFMSDNGANAFERSVRLNVPPWKPASRLSQGIEWAAVSNTPYRWYKQNAHMGGVAVPFLLHWPEGDLATGWNHSDAHIVDVYPTLLEILGIKYPDRFKNRPIGTLVGESLVPQLRGESPERRNPIWYNFRNNAGLRHEGMKLISFKGGPWRLYDFVNDPFETTDIADKHPEKVREMDELWYHIANEINRGPFRQRTPRLEEDIAWGSDPVWSEEANNWVDGGRTPIENAPNWPDFRPPVYDD
jgi:arylsulfatase A-like enzyme